MSKLKKVCVLFIKNKTMYVKLINSFFETIGDMLLKDSNTLKNSVSIQLKIERLKVKLFSEIMNKKGRITLIYENISISFCKDYNMSPSFGFIIDKNVNNYEKLRQ